ncbi:intracellular protease, ThiJ/PfpI family [Legionella beliardensis]|uniref:Intracellular protease, ThiJ/PfpI family n=1 Tax=Legionella beliardensis TaxID=91822 RepID=A0A378I539_9GAMM|nr:type 1 glutamine amidotransferase domain-containing protein [Legionella beliardensis]STX30133.1 intracellular protease, ThiJ/PfpI family [Legionella beliardensis]
MGLAKKKVGILIENDYQELEFWYPYLRLQEEGIEPLIIGKEIKSYKSKLGYEAKADVTAEEASSMRFDAVIIPGGYAPDKMRTQQPMVQIIKNTYTQGGVVAAICHAGWVLISAKILDGKKVTGVKSIKDDLINAGAQYLDEQVVVDGNLITSRTPVDLPFFCQQIIAKLQ